jgi:hypothetical protein
MVTVTSKTQAYLDEVERFSKRKFLFRHEISVLIDVATLHSKQQLFDEITFMAKFITNASNILKREGAGKEETSKLEYEFKHAIEKSSSLVQELVGNIADEKNLFAARFFSLTQEGMSNFMKLLNELSWLKNYSLDTNRQL